MTLDDVYKKYHPTIGIECHVQLKTKTKLFSGADNDAREAAPNTTVSPICFGLPGVLPVLNQEALHLAVRAGLALKADIPKLSRFERKHYFYPDLPLGYQITQLAEPVIVGGTVEAVQLDGTKKSVRLHHAHLESDAGKLTHPSTGSYSLVDLNRAGTPLIEIVSEADIHSPAEARAYCQALHALMVYAGVTYGDLYHGNMRFDVNLSLAPIGQTELGTRSETKNLNSFRSVEKAAEYEIVRQAELLDKGEKIIQETRGWNDAKQTTFSQRSKENAHDYRYFPDADIPPVIIEQQYVEEVRQTMPKLPEDYRTQFAKLGVDATVIEDIIALPSLASTIERLLATNGAEHARRVTFWLLQPSIPGVEATQPADEQLVELSQLVSDGKLSSTAAKEVFNELAGDETPTAIATRKQLLQVSDEAAIEKIVIEVMNDNPQAVEDVKAGEMKAIGFLVGQVMKASKGSANPALAQALIKKQIDQ